MKTIISLFFLLIISFASTQIKAQIVEEWYSIEEILQTSSNVPEEMLDGITYKLSSNEPLYYDKTFYLPDQYHSISFNIPFASEFYIDGGHVHFVINKEDFMFYIYRVHKDVGYYD